MLNKGYRQRAYKAEWWAHKSVLLNSRPKNNPQNQKQETNTPTPAPHKGKGKGKQQNKGKDSGKSVIKTIDKKDLKCNFCGKQGHTERDCFRNPNSASYRASITFTSHKSGAKGGGKKGKSGRKGGGKY